jgi:hypothetical protein
MTQWKQLASGHWAAEPTEHITLGAGALTDGTGFWFDSDVVVLDYGPYPTLEAAKKAAELSVSIASLRTERYALREAVRLLLACPCIADATGEDKDEETDHAERIARAALARVTVLEGVESMIVLF